MLAHPCLSHRINRESLTAVCEENKTGSFHCTLQRRGRSNGELKYMAAGGSRKTVLGNLSCTANGTKTRN